jgi:hypothetical protein
MKALPERQWNLEDIRWSDFAPALVDAELTKIVKAAALVESNGPSYADYLCGVFDGDGEFQSAARAWALEEEQHGKALARWAALADPAFDYAGAFGRFSDKIRLPIGTRDSVRGSRSSELIARCMVEIGTSSFYSAIRDASAEPVLREICARIAADEIRHYKLFRVHLDRYQESERLPLWRRILVLAARVRETGDDELPYAYWAGNGAVGVYDRKSSARAYARRAYRLYRPVHFDRAAAMGFKAVGLKPDGLLCRLASRLARFAVGLANRRLAAAGA